MGRIIYMVSPTALLGRRGRIARAARPHCSGGEAALLGRRGRIARAARPGHLVEQNPRKRCGAPTVGTSSEPARSCWPVRERRCSRATRSRPPTSGARRSLAR